jgi:hypothetical protein
MKYSKYAIRAATVLLLLLLGPAARAQLNGSLPPGTEEVLEEIQRTMYPPWLYSVTLEPDPPRAGEPVIVTAEIYNDQNKINDKTIEAYMFYSVDESETWETVEMEDMGGASQWRAELPPFEKGAEVWYGFRAGDATGNVFTETPCYVTSWPPENDTCMFDFSVDEPPVDDPERLVPDDFDIVSIKGGMDEDNLYVEFTVQGNIEPGSVSPAYLHLYGIAVANLDKGNPTDIISQGFLGLYVPLAHVAGMDPCMTVSQPHSDILFTEEYIQCLARGEHLWFRVNNKQIGKTEPQGHLKIIAADGAVTSIAPFAGIYYDYTHVTSMSLAGRSFVVE